MTARARGIRRVLDHALALRARGIGGCRLGQVRIHAGWRVRHDLTQQMLAHEQATRRGRRLDRSGCRSEKRRLAENAGAWERFGELDDLELSRRLRQTVQPREIGIQEAVVGRQRFHEIAIVPHEVPQKHPRLLHHHRRELRRKRRIPSVVFRRGQHAIEAQPLAEELIGRLPRARVLQHRARHALETFGRPKLAFRGRVKKRAIGHRVPQEV